MGSTQMPYRPRILLVDDHDLVREAMATLLEDQYKICGEASNGIEAAEKARELKPDLVLLDLSMPGLSGTKAARLIREFSPDSKILFLSMHDAPEVANLVRITGADGFVSKHCRAQELKEAVRALISSQFKADTSKGRRFEVRFGRK